MSISKVLLVNPARNYIPNMERKVCVQPLGLCYLAAVIRDAGYKVKIIDMTSLGYDNETESENGFVRYGLSLEEMAEKIKEYGPDLVGVGCVQTLQLYEAYEVFNLVKKIDSNIITVFGGMHASALYEKEAKCGTIDYVVVGEGEITLCNLINSLKKGRLAGEKLSGVAYWFNSKLIYSKGERIEDLDNLPFPAYDLLAMDKYNHPLSNPSSYSRNAAAIIQTSRGCPHRCLHCPIEVVFGKGYRCRSIDNVISEINILVNNYGVKEICIEDSNFTVARKRVLEFCNKIKENKIKVRMSLPHGIEIDTLDYDLLINMREAGFYALHLSIESANQTVLSTQDKKIILDKVVGVVNIAKNMGYKITGYFMIGFPNEKEKDIEETVNFAGSLKLDKANFFIYTPLPGTRLYDDCLNKNLFVDNFDITHLRYSKANLNTSSLNHEKIQKFRIDSYRRIQRLNNPTEE